MTETRKRRQYLRRSSSAEHVTLMSSGSGLELFFGPLEAMILDWVWGQAHPITVVDTFAMMQQLDPSIHLTTVESTLNRLTGKGLLDRQPVAGVRSYRYIPKLSREQFLSQALIILLTRLCTVVSPRQILVACRAALQPLSDR